MKVFTKILGAVLLLGCLAYISFVFGKYVLSSTMLKSIPKSERIISTDNPSPTRASVPASSPDEQTFSPQVKMRVMPSTRSTRNDSADNDNRNDSSAASSDSQDDADNDISKKPKKFDEEEFSSSHRRRSRRSKRVREADHAKKVTPETQATTKSPKTKSSSNPAPIRRLNQVDKKEESSPIPKPEKSTSTPSNNGDSANISPVPKPE